MKPQKRKWGKRDVKKDQGERGRGREQKGKGGEKDEKETKRREDRGKKSRTGRHRQTYVPWNCTTGCPRSLWKEQEFTLFGRGKRFQSQPSQQSVITPGALLNYRFASGAGGKEILNCVPGKAQAGTPLVCKTGEYKYPNLHPTRP